MRAQKKTPKKTNNEKKGVKRPKVKSKRRNNPPPTVSEALERAIALLEDAGEYDPRASIAEVVTAVRQLEKAHGDNIVTLPEATMFARQYAKTYFNGGNGVIIPYDADLYFEGSLFETMSVSFQHVIFFHCF